MDGTVSQTKEQQGPPRWVVRSTKYLFGAVLAYFICVLIGGSMLSNEFAEIVSLGLVMGFVFFLILGPAHFFFQLLVRWMASGIWSLSERASLLIVNVPALGVLVALGISLAMPQSPTRLRARLQEHFGNPLPPSAEVKGYRMWRGLNEGSYTFALSLKKSDLGQFLSNSGCILNTSNLDEMRWTVVRSNVLELSKSTVTIDPPLSRYTCETTHGTSHWTKTIIVGSNQTDVVFLESFF